jgi:predicted Zn-dependent protease with MMP-like domain
MMESRSRFDELVADALDGLPDWVARSLDNVEILVDEEPPPDEPHLLGRYEGVPKPNRGFSYSGVIPDRVTLFRSTIVAAAGADDVRLRAVIEHTLRHELGHYFGIDDDRLREIGAY